MYRTPFTFLRLVPMRPDVRKQVCPIPPAPQRPALAEMPPAWRN